MEEVGNRLKHIFDMIDALQDELYESLNEIQCYVATTKRLCEEHGGQTVPEREMCDPEHCSDYNEHTCKESPCPDCILSVVPFNE